MPPSAGRLRLLQRVAFTANIAKGSGPQARGARRLIRRDPGNRAPSVTRATSLESLPPHLHCQHVRDHTQEESLRRALDDDCDRSAPRTTDSSQPTAKGTTKRGFQQVRQRVKWPAPGPTFQSGVAPSECTTTVGTAKDPTAAIPIRRSRFSRADGPSSALTPSSRLVKTAALLSATLTEEDPYVVLALRGAAFRNQ